MAVVGAGTAILSYHRAEGKKPQEHTLQTSLERQGEGRWVLTEMPHKLQAPLPWSILSVL